MFPTTAAKLKPGDCCFIQRNDGQFVPFAYLCSVRNKRSSFYGGILDALLPTPDIDALPPVLAIKEFALVHLACFKENNTPIVGNVADRIGDEVLSVVVKSANNFSVGATSRVWGHRTIVKYAETVA